MMLDRRTLQWIPLGGGRVVSTLGDFLEASFEQQNTSYYLSLLSAGGVDVPQLAKGLVTDEKLLQSGVANPFHRERILRYAAGLRPHLPSDKIRQPDPEPLPKTNLEPGLEPAEREAAAPQSVPRTMLTADHNKPNNFIPTEFTSIEKLRDQLDKKLTFDYDEKLTRINEANPEELLHEAELYAESPTDQQLRNEVIRLREVLNLMEYGDITDDQFVEAKQVIENYIKEKITRDQTLWLDMLKGAKKNTFVREWWSLLRQGEIV